MFNREPSDSRSDDDGKRKSVESLPSQRNVRLSIQPFDDSDDMTASQHGEAFFGTETPMYSSGSVIWKSSSEAILDADTHPQQQQQRGSATDSCSSEQAPDSDGRRLSERDMASSESSDVVLSSDCSLSSEQSPVHQAERDHQRSTSISTVAVPAVVDLPVKYSDVVSGSTLDDANNVNISDTAGSCVCGLETAADEADCSQEGASLLDEINDHLKQTHGQHLLPESVPGMSGSAGKRNSEDMSLLAIDTALAEVMSGLELLGRSRGLSLDHGSTGSSSRHPAATVSSSSSPSGSVASPHTPDLVVGLPQFAAQSATSPQPLEVARSPPPATAQLTTAEMFANVDRCTIKKSGPSTSAPSSAEIWTSPVHPLRVAESPPLSAALVDGGTVSVAELPTWSRSPLRSFGDSGRVRTRGSPARSQSCRAAERQSDQTWSSLWMTSTEIQREREFVRSVVPQLTAARQPPGQPLSPPSPGRDNGVSFDRTELPRFPSSACVGPGTRKEPTHSFIATLPRDGAGGPKTPVKVKPPVMKKPARSAEMMRRLSEYQHSGQHVADSACSGLPK